MKIEKIFEVVCVEYMFSDKKFHIAVYGAKTNGGNEFAVVYSELENSLEDEYPDRSTFERFHGEPNWFAEFEDVYDELEDFPWTRGILCYQLLKYEAEIKHLVCKTTDIQQWSFVD